MDKIIPIIFGERLRKTRLELGLTQQELADLCGVSKQTVSRYELAKIQRITEPVITMFSIALNVDPVWLSGMVEASDLFKKIDYVLNSEEADLVHKYRQLNSEGRMLAFTQIENLSAIPKYLLDDDVLAAHNDSEITDKEVELMEEDAKSLEDLALKDERNKNNVDGV